MRATLPYTFCQSLGCTNMVNPGSTECLRCFEVRVFGVDFDLHFPDLEILSAAASQQTNSSNSSVSGDADSEESKS